ncbi:MAG: 2,3-dehydroadipyl-CoA hydratase [Ectothiorhodospiraceae bacterium]|jgi:enoyl-CoA hydratase
MTAYEDILVDHTGDGVLQVTLNRPQARNALRTQLLEELADCLDAATTDDSVRCVVLTGGPKVFAAGADIKELAALDAVGVTRDRRPACWQRIARFRKPIVAAVNGYALGGGCELVMHADIVIAAEDAQFGQPEINLGIIPGAGGTQRLIRTVGKPLAMKMVLSGEWIDAPTAREAGLIAEITPRELTIERAHEIARRIASKPPVAVEQAKEVMLQAFETGLTEGLALERKAFAILAATEDRAEGLAAFMEKRKAEFKGR